MWYAGSKDRAQMPPTAGPPRALGPRGGGPTRSQSQTSLRPRGAGGETLPSLAGATRRGAANQAASAAWQGSTLRGARSASGRSIGKSPPATAAALLSLSGGGSDFADAEAAQAKEVLRIGPWSVRRAPGGPDAGLLYVNVETGRAQREPPQEVLEELGMDNDEDGDGGDGGDGEDQDFNQTTTSGGGRSIRDSRPGTGGSGGSPSTTESPAKFQRIVLGSRNETPLAMARDIRAALVEDVSLFDAVRQRFSDVLSDEGPWDLDGLPEELDGIASALAPGEVSQVIGTDSGMQILLRIS
mmetsp:Transcript_6254/g.17916  ORF Transcript_6254/g.17916 Transcript_6254/m.17916 type:complete len:299 (-) Transcript_6254:138-1034(-)